MSSPPPSPKDHSRLSWWPWVVMYVVLYIVAAPPVYYFGARVGLVHGNDEDRRRPGAVDACVAPARWIYEDSPLKPVLRPWAEFWYDVLLT